MTGGHIMQLQNFSVNDGEGIRTNIFLSGCPLACQWCSNPEGQTLVNPMTTYMTVDEVVKRIEQQMIFYRMSGGGVTFSGGEATVQKEFLKELTDVFYDRGISLAIETCGFFHLEEVCGILEKMDLIFYDIKQMNAEKHKAFTGVSNEIILSNLAKVASLSSSLVIRIPMISGVNTEEENRRATLSYIKQYVPKAKLELLPYHTLGESKYKELGLPIPSAQFRRPKETEMMRWEWEAVKQGIEVVSYK